MRYFVYLILLSTVTQLQLFSQSNTFIRTQGRPGNDLAETLIEYNNGYCIVGSTTSFSTSRQLYIIRLDSSFTILDTMLIAVGNDIEPRNSVPTNKGVIVIAGITVPSISSTVRPAVLHFDISGDSLKWGSLFYRYTSASKKGFMHDGILDKDTLFVVGGCRNNSAFAGDFIFYKIDTKSGDTLISKSYEGGNSHAENWVKILWDTHRNHLFISGACDNPSGV